MQQNIIDFLIKKYDPLAAALIGSRTNGTDHSASDWELCVFVKNLPKPNFKYEESEYGLLDIVFYERPKADFVIETALAPIPNVTSLYDPNDILLDNLLLPLWFDLHGEMILVLKNSRQQYSLI